MHLKSKIRYNMLNYHFIPPLYNNEIKCDKMLLYLYYMYFYLKIAHKVTHNGG